MLRLALPGGFLNAAQLLAIARVAAEKGGGFADLTTRQDVRLRKIRPGEEPAILEALRGAGVAAVGAGGDAVRNVVGCPVAGVDAAEYFDASPVLREVADLLAGNAEFADLPGKYKVSVSACRDQCPQPEIQCVSFVGVERQAAGGAEKGFDLRVGGGLAGGRAFSRRLNAFVRPAQVLPVLRAITGIYRDAPECRQDRDRARMKHLVAGRGVEQIRRELQQRMDFPLEETGPCEDPAEGGRDHIGVHEQKQPGLFYVGVPVFSGRIAAEQMRKAADLAQRHGDGTVRLTVRQDLLLLNLPQERVAAVLEGLQAVGLGVGVSPIRRGVLACSGIEFCRRAAAQTKARAREIVEHLEGSVLLEEPLRIHVEGCANGCAHAPIAHIGLQGSAAAVEGRTVEAYDVAVGGQLGRDRCFNHGVARQIPADEVKFRLERLLLAYKRLRKERERLNDFCRRVGDQAVAELLSAEPAEAGEAAGKRTQGGIRK